MNPPRLYFSHPSHELGDEAHAMETELRIRGLREGGFIDVKGCVTKAVMEKGIRACAVFVIQLANRVLESKWMQLELSLALQFGKPIAPIIHAESPIPNYMGFLSKLYDILVRKQQIQLSWESFQDRFGDKPIDFCGCVGSSERDIMFRKILGRGSEFYQQFLLPLVLPPTQVLVVGNAKITSGPCNVIALELCNRGFGAVATNDLWLSYQSLIGNPDELKKMSIIVFLSQNCWRDPVVAEKIRFAQLNGTPMMFFIEKDRRRKGYCSIEEVIQSAPKDIRPIFDEVHIIGFSFDSRSTFMEVMLDHMEDRLNLKTFAAFLSHHKAGAKSDIRLIKDRLQGELEATHADFRKVFLDVDNALRLDELENYIKASKVVVLVLTPDVLTRPFVLVELISALIWRIPIVTVHFKGFEFDRVRLTLAQLSDTSEEIVKSMFPHTAFTEIQYLLETAPIGMILSQEYDTMANEVTLHVFFERLVKRIQQAEYRNPSMSRIEWESLRNVSRKQSVNRRFFLGSVTPLFVAITFVTGLITGSVAANVFRGIFKRPLAF